MGKLFMRLKLDASLAARYTNPTQKARVITEDWVLREGFCPSCGSRIGHYENNRPVRDFYCQRCTEDFEVKSKRQSFGKKIVDGAYGKMMSQLTGEAVPNFFLMNYDFDEMEVLNFLVVPKHFLSTDLIEKRKPLAASAERAGWTGCNILLDRIPQSGRIHYITDGKTSSKREVLENWEKTLFLRDSHGELKGWLLDVMSCIEGLEKEEFTLQEAYSFEPKLSSMHPKNRNVKPKIRQQLQFLRDKGYLEFSGRGRYRLS